jgi:hypothetical protein
MNVHVCQAFMVKNVSKLKIMSYRAMGNHAKMVVIAKRPTQM